MYTILVLCFQRTHSLAVSWFLLYYFFDNRYEKHRKDHLQLILDDVISRLGYAAAFGKVGFPIRPQVAARTPNGDSPRRGFWRRLLPATNGHDSSLIFRRAHPTLVTPRDFDLSPYFEIVKFNMIEPTRFDYRKIVWVEDAEEHPLPSPSES